MPVQDLNEAKSLAPEDKAIAKELVLLKRAMEAARKKQAAAFSKMFA